MTTGETDAAAVMDKTDRELLELAAKAAGLQSIGFDEAGLYPAGMVGPWNPLTDDGDALRLAVKTQLPIGVFLVLREPGHSDPYAATRRAIVRAAAAIGESMQ